MIEQGLMTEHGQAWIDLASTNGSEFGRMAPANQVENRRNPSSRLPRLVARSRTTRPALG
jgi:hypothetical protein